MTQSHYSLRWNNHQSHILAAFDALLQAETLVDVTLVCAETSVRAHKVVLSACSPFFQRIFSENPCKHPVIVLKDFSGWEVQAIVDFMYKGEISVVQEQLQSLIKAAESLQVRGLANQDPFGVEKESTPVTNQTPTPTTSPNDYDRGYFNNNNNNNHHHNNHNHNHNNHHHHHHHHNNSHNNNSHNAGRYPTPGVAVRTPVERMSPFSPLLPLPQNNFEPPPPPPPVKLPHMPRLSFPETLLPTRQECHSPIPRRKQARPRRRSGEMCAPQDLSTHSVKVEAAAQPQPPPPPPPPPPEETAENLCIKRPHKEEKKELVKKEEEKPRTPEMNMHAAISPEMDLSMHGLGKDFRTSPVNMHPVLNLKQEIDNHSPLPFPPMPSVSALAMTPPHIFGLEPPLGLFPPGLDGCRNPLFDLPDPRTTPDPHIFVKKKMGRPKGQHSAPRGGPPRSWTNAELTEALQHVWNKKMTTSQASRIFGIPYNSLLMYVRGKYGKSLKLEQLRKDCIGGPNPTPMDLLNLGGGGGGGGGPNNNNNTPCKPERIEPIEQQLQPNTRPPSAEEQHPHGPLFNPFTHNFYPDFGTGFPIPVSMIHLLPQSEKSKDHFGQQSMLEEECKERLKELEDEHDLFRPPMLSVEDRRELVQQNGQD